jgi:hypothetical protein
MRRGSRERARGADRPKSALPEPEAAPAETARLADAAAAGPHRFRALPDRTRPEDMVTSQDEHQVPLAETDPNRDSALRWGLGTL